MHLLVDGYEGNRDKLESLDLTYEILNRFPEAISMTKIMPPYVVRYVGTKPQDWGISGFVMIAESHISIHTFPEKGFVNIDIFSCKEFDAQQAVDYLRREFELGRVESQVIARGLEYVGAPAG